MDTKRESELLEALEKDSDNLELRSELVEFYLDSKRIDKALEALDERIKVQEKIGSPGAAIIREKFEKYVRGQGKAKKDDIIEDDDGEGDGSPAVI